MKSKPRVSFEPADQSPSIKQEKKSISPNHWPSNRPNLHESRIFLASRLAQNEFDELFAPRTASEASGHLLKIHPIRRSNCLLSFHTPLWYLRAI